MQYNPMVYCIQLLGTNMISILMIGMLFSERKAHRALGKQKSEKG